MDELVSILQADLRSTICEKLPTRANQLHALAAKCSGIVCQRGDDFMRPPKQLTELIGELHPILVDTVTELHSIEAKCNGIKNDEKICSGVKLFENIECLHNLLKEAREKAEQLSGRIDKYFEDQERFDAGKTIYRALVASYDLRTKKEIQIGLCIIRNQIVSLHPKLQHNLELVLSAGSSKSAHLGMGMFT